VKKAYLRCVYNVIMHNRMTMQKTCPFV